MAIYTTTLEMGLKRQGVYVEADKMPSGDLLVTYQDDRGSHPVEVTSFQAWLGPVDKPTAGYRLAIVSRKGVGGSYVTDADKL